MSVMSRLVSAFFFFLLLLLSVLVIPVTESKEPVATVSFNLSRPIACIGVFINIWIESSSSYSLCSRINLGSSLLYSSSSHSFSICQPDDVIFHFTSVNSLLPICGQVVNVISVEVSNSTYAVPVKQCSELSLSLSSPIIRINNESVSVLNSTCGCNPFMINPPRSSVITLNDQYRCFDDQGSCPENYSITASPLLQCLPGKSLITGTCNKGLFTETSSCSQCGQLDEPVCNYDTQFSGIISMINQSANGALQSLSEQLTEFTPEQSIELLDNIISKGINTSLVNATEMVLRTAELIIDELRVNETVTVKLSVATQFLLSLDTFALKVAQSTSFDYGNTFLNVTRNESFSGERLTVLNYKGNSLSLPAKIFNNSLPATVASFVYSNLSSILSPSDGRKLISPVISAAVDCNGACITNALTEPVVISFILSEHTQPILSSAISCVFWNIELSNDSLPSGFWDNEGCNVASVDQQSVTCHCNHFAHFAILPVNVSSNGALQSLSEQLTQFTPEQSIELLDDIISRGINTSVVNATEMVLRTAELIVNKLPINEAVTVKHSVATQFLLSLDTFALKVAQSTSFGYGNTFLNVTRNESFSGERLTVLNYNGNSLSLPAKILNNSLPATVASFVYSNLSSILSPSDGRKLISPVISAAVNCIGTCITSELTEPVVISFTLLRHTQPILSSAISCVFWNISRSNDLLPSGFWDTEGCNASSVDQQSVTCQCNHFAHFAILPVNQSTIGALQNLFEELDQFTPEQSITLLDNIINEVINITVDVTEMVLKTAELIVNKLTVNETRTVTQFLLSLDTFALKVAQSTSFGYGNTFSNVTQIESFSGERLTVLNYNGNSLSLPAMIFNNSLPATVASFVYSGNKLLSILSPTEPDNRKLISPVVSATVECNSTCITSELTEPVVITFALLRHAQLISFSTISCVFWNTTLGFWDNEGCNASSVDQQSVTCHCNHLTHFAILPVNRSPIGALQSLFEELDRLTPEQSITLLDNIINRVINITVDVTEMVLRTAELIINELPTNELVTVKLSVVTQFLVSLDTFALNVAESTILPQSTNLTQSTPLNFGNIFLNVTRIESFSGERLTVLNYNGNSLSLPAMIFIDSLPATVASFVYSGNSLLSILSPTEPDNRELISPVISATVECNGTCITDELTEPVIISFNLSGYTEQTLSSMSSPNISCVFWNIALSNDSLPSGFWDNEGCNASLVDQKSVTCQCNHLTHFAILLSPGGSPPADSLDSKILTIAGQILVPISLVCLLMVILTYSCLRSLRNMRNYIHIMLCSNLLISQLIFLIGIERTANPSLCSAIAVLLQYMFLVTFMWMLMEGVVLYVSLVKVFVKHPKHYIIGFTIISYGAPALYMLFIVPIGFLVNTPDHSHYLYYDNDTLFACWLSYESGFIWAFIGPVILIIIANFGFFIMSLVIIRRQQKKQGRGIKPQHWIKSALSLTIIMGIGWIGSVLFFSQRLLFIAYIMTIFIAGQGIIIFILYVPLSSNVREAYAKLLKKRLANWSLTRSKASGDSKKKSTEGNLRMNTIDNGLDAEKSKSMA